MFARMTGGLALLLAGCAAPVTAPVGAPPAIPTPADWTTSCGEWDEWDKPGPPFRIHGDTYYVGTCGISAILVADPAGHVLIDTGTAAGADTVLANIRRLGFDPDDVAMILHSHEHFDHVGGHARVQAATGADIVASVEAAPALRSGDSDPRDPQHGMHPPMAPLTVARTVGDGDEIRLGDNTLTAIATPGHTPGALSWRWQSCADGSDCRTIVYADSLSAVSSDEYRFSDHPDYLAAYRTGIARLAASPCDILLTPHPSASRMVARAATGSLVGGMTCTEYATAISQRLDARLAEEAP